VQALNYIRMDRIAKNEAFVADSKYGKLDITINLSKPEKDPKSIAMQAKAKMTSYPKCVLCVENEGFSGNVQRDSRNQHRLLKFDVNGENYYFQYSPYIYYNEHAIIINETHKPMKIDQRTFENLLSLVDIFDGYFFGSNADLPIVGGSILSHDHYQGGNHVFPIERAEVFYEQQFNDYKIELINWPLSTIRLSSKNKEVVVNQAVHLLEVWKNYSNKELDIVDYTGDVRHHTITPITRKSGDEYIAYLVLRDNHTTDEFPLGVFHPHEEVWHIKKENIGLIEVMGLGILPGRLVVELDDVKSYVLNKQEKLNYPAHQAWADELKNCYDGSDIDRFIEAQVGLKFEKVLSYCGVFKMNKKEQETFISFVRETFKS